MNILLKEIFAGTFCLHCMLKSSLWFPRVQWQTFQIQQLCIHTQCSVILACHWWYKLFVHWWMKGIFFASFYFRVWDLTREIRENKKPAKISTYTVQKWTIGVNVVLFLTCHGTQTINESCIEGITNTQNITNTLIQRPNT